MTAMIAGTQAPIEQELVLVGGGHTHVQLLRRWIMKPMPGVRLTLVTDAPVALYSGMIPAVVAGQLPMSAAEIDLVPLARRAGARVILAACTGIDPESRRIHLRDRPAIQWDVASVDVGSTVRGRDLPGVATHTIPTRPIGRLPGRISDLVARARTLKRPLKLTVVGGGAAGFELATCTRERLLKETGEAAEVTLVFGRPQLLHGSSAALSRAAARAATARGVRLRPGVSVAEVSADGVLLATETGAPGEQIPSDAVLWAGGAAAHPWLAKTGLPCDPNGYLRVGQDLRVDGCDDLFAAGDCAVVAGYELTPRAGVYAVRAGPTLDHNVRARLRGATRLRTWRPQRDFLALLNLGDGTAVGGKWGVSFSGAWVYALKDRIDRDFMRNFQALKPSGAPSTDVPAMPDMGEMICGGCAAKVGEAELSRALGRLPPRPDERVLLGVDAGDDVAATRLPGGGALVSTVDVFRAFADDPWLVGRVAALNALSDSWVAGGAPSAALAIVAIPDREPGGGEEALYQLLAGARSVLDAHDVALVGGHTTTAPELLVGFTVFGALADATALQAGGHAQPGDVLVLSKPLGTGVVLHADGAARAPGLVLNAAYAAMQQGNAAAAEVARAHGATAVTDVTGFGLAGHLGALLRRAAVAAEVRLSALPVLPGVEALLAGGERSTLHETNARAGRGMVIPAELQTDDRLPLLFDPQTAGGVLAAVPPTRAAACVEALRRAGYGEAAQIGHVHAAGDIGDTGETGGAGVISVTA